MTLASDTKGQLDPSGGAKLVVGVALVVLLAAFLMPVAIDAFTGTQSTQSYTVDSGNTTEVVSGVNATVTSVDDTVSPSTATIELAYDAETVSSTIENGSSATYTLSGEDFTVNVSAVTASSATFSVDYTQGYDWNSGAQSLWNIIGIIIILVLLMMLIYYALRASDMM